MRTYNVGDVLEGKVTKVVSFGAFVEIMEGVEGLVHISELAQHHVENPREVVEPGDDGEGQDPRDRRGAPPPVAQPQARRGPGACRGASWRRSSPCERPGDGRVGDVPDLGLSEEVFAPEARRGAGGGPQRPRRRRSPAAEAEAPRTRPSEARCRSAEAAAEAEEAAGRGGRSRSRPSRSADEQT